MSECVCVCVCLGVWVFWIVWVFVCVCVGGSLYECVSVFSVNVFFIEFSFEEVL